MTLDIKKLTGSETLDLEHQYTVDDCILYALSLGFGDTASDRKALPYVYEGEGLMQTVPTMASVLVPDMFPPDLGWDYGQVLHVDQRLQIFRPLPAAAELLIDKRISDIFDLGEKLGALVMFEAEGRRKKDGSVLFQVGSTIMARGDGGFGGQKGSMPKAHRIPKREPDLVCDIETGGSQALLYRLNGDRNPLHADPAVARKAGFDRPILHGLCSYGIACHAILKTICEYDHTLIAEFDARFSQPVLPGDTVTTEMWQDGNTVSFQCSVKDRDAVVVKNGKCVLRT